MTRFCCQRLIVVTLRMISLGVLVECREQADRWMTDKGAKPRSIVGAVVIASLWAILLGWCGHHLWSWLQNLA